MTDDPEFRLLWWQHLTEEMSRADKAFQKIRPLAEYMMAIPTEDADAETVKLLQLFLDGYHGVIEASLIYCSQIHELQAYIRELQEKLND